MCAKFQSSAPTNWRELLRLNVVWGDAHEPANYDTVQMKVQYRQCREKGTQVICEVFFRSRAQLAQVQSVHLPRLYLLR